MPVPHFNIKITQRSKGNSAVAGAAYQAGEKLFSEYDQKTKNYTCKKEVVYTEIMLPPNAPPEYADRATLWNSVEEIEKQWNSQLARRFVAALPREVPMELLPQMVKEYCEEQFVSKGMCCDFAIHDPDPPGHNPHCHFMLTMRAIDENGKWMPKSRKVYDLDENGERIKLPSGRWKSHKEDTVDWNEQYHAEEWRHGWEIVQNKYLELAGSPERIDMRSYERQGLDIIPTVHMGTAVSALERKGIATNIGNLNRDIKAANRMMNAIRSTIKSLRDWIADILEATKEVIAENEAEKKNASPNLAVLLRDYLNLRKAERSEWSRYGQQKGTTDDLKTISQATVYTPGHMDFLAEVYRSLAVLDGAILVISAKDGVQAQTRILFHALRKMNIPTVIFINKIDQAGVDLQSVVQSVRDKLSADIIIKQTVSLSPEIVLEENTDIEAWDAVIENNDKLLEKYIAGEPISREKLVREEQRRVQDASLFPVYYGSAKKGLGIQPLMDAVTGLFQPIGEQGSAALCGSVFKVEYTDCGQRRVYLRLYSGTLRLRDTVALAGREKLKITEMRIPSKGEIVRTDTAYPGEIVILPSDSVRLNDVLGDQTRLPRKRWREDPLPMLRTTIAPKTAAQRERLLDALTQLADTDPLLRCEVDSITHEIILSFLGRVQLEVVSALLSEKYKLETVVKEPSVIYMERPLKAASHTIHIEVPPNPFWASIGLSVTPLSLGSGVQYESRVSLGYLNQSFQNAVRDGIRYGLEQGLFGWNVTDCKICFEYGLYYSPVSTPADFRSLAPIVLEQALKESGTQLLEPYLSFILYAPQEYLSRAYHDAPNTVPPSKRPR